jgi:hypothetical protein
LLNTAKKKLEKPKKAAEGNKGSGRMGHEFVTVRGKKRYVKGNKLDLRNLESTNIPKKEELGQFTGLRRPAHKQ